MREVSFIRRNQERWQQIEAMVTHPEIADASALAVAYVQLMDDLAFSRSQFPKAHSTTYLNNLATQVHSAVARNKRMRIERLRALVYYEFPMAFVSIRPHLAITFTVFIICASIGFISALENESFARSVLGGGYVDMTVENIKNGRPLDVYDQEAPLQMFLHIAFNNILILLRTVGLGLFPVVGVAYILITNSVMVGTFIGLFAQHGQLATATLGIWIHGTLEISAIIVGCAAATRVTQAVLHPGTYPRIEAFRCGVRTAIMVAIGMVPLLLVAAILESYVTRFYAVSPLINVSVIMVSLAFVVWYVIVWPVLLLRRGGYGT